MRDFPIRTTDVGPVGALRRGTDVVARTPRDLIAVGGFAVLAVVALTVVDVSSTIARAAIGFPFLFLAPGYAIVSILFPRRIPVGSADGGARWRPWQTTGLSDTERIALSFGLSFAVLPLIALAIAAASRPYEQSVVVTAVGSVVLVGTVVAAVRRLRLPEAVRYRVEFRAALAGAFSSVFDADSSAGVAVNVALVLSVVIAVSSVGFALVSPQQGERYTDAQLLTENESGDLVASGYPSNATVDEPEELILALENREGERTDYEVVVVLDRVDDRDGEQVVIERQGLDRFETTLEDGERWTHRHEIAPGLIGDDLRVSYLVYEGDAPADPSADDAYRHLYFWTDVTRDAGESVEDGDAVDDADSGGDADGGGDVDDDDEDDE